MKNNKLARLFVWSVCLLFVSGAETQSAAAREKQSDRKILQLKGAVKRLEMLSPSGGLKDVYVFNEAGDILEQASVYKDDNRFFKRLVNFYDAAGRKTAAEFYAEGKLKIKSVFQYDDANNLVVQTDSDAEGKLFSKIVRKYDERGNLLETLGNVLMPGIFDKDAASALDNYREFYRYDERDNLAEMQSFIADVKAPLVHILFVYNRENQKIESTSFSHTYTDKPPRISKYFYTYNKQGDPVEERYYEPVKETNTEEIRDKFKIIDNKGTVQNGVLISDKPYMILWSVNLCAYTYDGQGNWTKKNCQWKMRETKDFMPAPTDSPARIITYFP